MLDFGLARAAERPKVGGVANPIDRIVDLRDSYEVGGLSEAELAPTWLEQFEDWLEAALGSGMPQPNAMVLATARADATPDARTPILVERSEGVHFTEPRHPVPPCSGAAAR